MRKHRRHNKSFKSSREQGRRGFLAAMLVCLGLGSALAWNISGTVYDTDKETLISATVRLLHANDSTQVEVTTTNNEGNFTLKSISNGKYILQASYVGMETVHKDVTVSGANLKGQELTLAPSGVLLNETVVKGVRTPVKVMQDTIEYDADAYKTQPNAVVEDLLKRLPGVEVDSEGKITANGKEVSKILIDGKEFFTDDPKVGSKNIPVDMVQKLQVIDRKSDLARLTGVDDGEEETVINLSVKKGMNNGWFGNVDAGYGTDDRYKGNFMINHFFDGNQITFLGGGNNLNQERFTGGRGGFTRFGGDRGITTSQSFGVNFNVGKSETFRIGGDVMYSHSQRDSRQSSEREYLFADSTSYTSSNKKSLDKGHNISANFRMKWEIDSFNTIDFRPRLSLNYSRSNSADSSLTRAGDPNRSAVTRSINTAYNKGNSYEFGGRLIYNHKFASHRGRSFSWTINYNFSDRTERSNSYSWNKFYLLNDSVDLYDQYVDNRTWSNNVSTRLTWTEPLGDVKNGNFLTFAYNFSYRWNNVDKHTFDHPVIFPDGFDSDPIISEELNFNKDLSNEFRNHYMNQDIRVGYQKVSSTTNMEVGVSLVPQMQESFNLLNSDKNIPERWTWNFAPFLRYRYRVSKSRSMNLNYRSNASQPSMTQLQPVADMTNPLRIVVGNPNLSPTFRHNISLRFQDYNQDAQRSIMLMLNGSMTQNSIVSKTTYNNETGGQITTYENVNGVWNMGLMNMFSMPMPFCKTISFNNHIMANYNRNVGYNNGMRNISNSVMIMEGFSLAYRPENLELEIRPNYRLQLANNSLQNVRNQTVHNYGGTFNGVWYSPWGIVLNTDLTYTKSSGYSAGYDTKQWLWNASISYQFLPSRQATVSLEAYDILQQPSNISRNITANYISDEMYNSLTRYFMITFSYSFRTFKGQAPKTREQQEWERNFDGPPPGMRPPGGGRGPGGPGGPGPMGPMGPGR